MNKLLLTVALISFGFTNAQIKKKGVVELTTKIGSSSFFENFSYLDSDIKSTDTNSGVSIGATVDYYFNNRWSIRSGFSFDKMGNKYDKTNYITIPVNANWHFGRTRKWNLNFGLSPSLITNASSTIENIEKGDYKLGQIGFTYGIGYKIEINKKFGILLDVQFFDGLTNTAII
jgi:long-subunit fatty acid transport protein